MPSLTELAQLHRRLITTLGAASLIAFVSGAGFETPMILVAGSALFLGMVWEPSDRNHQRIEWFWRIAAFALAARAIYYVFTVPEDVVIPMVDILLALLASEALRPAETGERSRMYTLSFALMIAAAAYRAGVAFGLSFVVYSTVAVVALMVGHLMRESQRFGTKPEPLRTGFLWRVAALSSVMLFMSGLLFLAFPRVTRSWVTRNVQSSGAIIGFSDRVSLTEHGGRIYPNPEVVLRVEFPSQVPPGDRALYWRGRSYDYFDGATWWHSPRANALAVTANQYRERWPRARLQPKIFAVAADLPVLFTLHPTIAVWSHSRMRHFLAPTGDLMFDAVGGPPIYTVVAGAAQPGDAQLRTAGPATLTPRAAYLQLPELPSSIAALADSIAGSDSTQIDRVRAIENYLRTTFSYTLELPASAREATLEHFLFRRRAGHCEYFSTAMVVLLRTLGIPARNVNGFMGGDWNQFGNYMTVTQNQAHSWVEVWFPQYGWVTFDPTPSATGEVAAAQAPWYGPFRFLFDGLEHRWNKWVLEYNLESQMDFFRRAADAVGSQRLARDRNTDLGWRRWAPIAVLAFLILMVVRMWRTRTSAPERLSLESRYYIKLRRAYRKAGFGVANETPLAFVNELQQRRGPGSNVVAELVGLYLHSRFSGDPSGGQQRERIVALYRQAREALRASRTA